MFTVRLPQIERIREWLNAQSSEQLSYEPVGASLSEMPSGYHHIEWSHELGLGPVVFEEAKRALRQWACFNLSWTRVYGEGQPEIGKHLAIAAQAGGLWVVNFCRVVDVRQGEDSYSVVVGTLPRHIASGEEHLSIRWNRETDAVSFHIRSFSRPKHWWMRLATPIVRRQQARFCRDASAAMSRFIRAQARVPSASNMVAT